VAVRRIGLDPEIAVSSRRSASGAADLLPRRRPDAGRGRAI